MVFQAWSTKVSSSRYACAFSHIGRIDSRAGVGLASEAHPAVASVLARPLARDLGGNRSPQKILAAIAGWDESEDFFPAQEQE
jgi:hypothetical protein